MVSYPQLYGAAYTRAVELEGPSCFERDGLSPL